MIWRAIIADATAPPAGPALPPAVVLPAAVGVVAIVLWHLLRLRRTRMPPSRRRIRTANGVLMLLVAPLFAVGAGVLDHEQHTRAWVLTWLAVLALVWMCIVLALLDILNTMRLTAAHRRRARGLLHDLRAGSLRGPDAG